jgi:hypothetical protein
MLQVMKGDVYRPLIVACRTEVSHYTVLLEFKNGGSLLDARRIPSFIVMPLELLVLVVMLGSWIVNQCVFRKGNMALHNFITVTMVCAALTVLLNYLVLWSDSVRDSATILNLLQRLMMMIFEITLYSTMILAAKGWCIVLAHLSAADVTEIVLYCSVLFVFRALGTQIGHVVFVIVMFALTSTVLLILWMSLISGVRAVDKRILAHMMIIYKAGIDPYSTPIYFKHLVYTFLVHVYIIFFSGSVVIMSLDLAGSLNAWIKDMLLWILNAGVMCSIGFLFRARKVDCCSYMKLEGGTEICLETLEEFDPRRMDEETKEGLLQWQEGMSLPPPPVVLGGDKTVARDESGSEVGEELLCHV